MEKVENIKLGNVAVASAPVGVTGAKEEPASIPVEEVKDFNKLTKEELITLVTSLTEQNKVLSTKLDAVPGEKDKLVEDINNHYVEVLNRHRSIIKSLTNRLSLIQGILDLDKEEK